MNFTKRLRRFICGKKNREYAKIKYHPPRTPEQNSQRLIELATQDFSYVRDRTDQECILLGRFMSMVLLVERKLVQLLVSFDFEINDRMFGQKIEVYKDFIKAFDWQGDRFEQESYIEPIASMIEIKKIRDAMVHDLTKTSISYFELGQTDSFIKRRRPDLHKTLLLAEDENWSGYTISYKD
jgi:hypothetical protein